MSYAKKIIAFYKNLKIEKVLPQGVEILNPYQDSTAFALCESFYRKYYNDEKPRTIIIGINPGRYGGGITGIPFTDPVKLESICGISNQLQKKTELSADFIYSMIDVFGGPDIFYSKFYFNSVSPLGFTFEKKNLNYYDTPELMKALEHFIVHSLKTQAKFVRNDIAYCLGEGENFRHLKKFNERLKLFQRIVPLAHPRFIMQYKRKQLDSYIRDYVAKLSLS